MADPAYSFREFCDHLAAMESVRHYQHISTPGAGDIELTGEPCFENMAMRVMDYMRQIYPEEREAFYKGSRFTIIMNYVAHHITDFDTARVAVHGSSASLVSESIWRAAHQIFTRPFSELPRDPTPGEVIELAASYG